MCSIENYQADDGNWPTLMDIVRWFAQSASEGGPADLPHQAVSQEWLDYSTGQPQRLMTVHHTYEDRVAFQEQLQADELGRFYQPIGHPKTHMVSSSVFKTLQEQKKIGWQGLLLRD